MNDILIINWLIYDSVIRVESASEKVIMDGLIFTSNQAFNDHSCFKFVSLSQMLVQNSQFYNNTGVTSQDLYISSFNSGTVTFKNTTFTGKGKDNASDLDVYDMKTGIVIEGSTNIYFENWTFSDYVKVNLGAAMSVSESTVVLTDSIIKDNHANIGAGIAVLLESVLTTDSWTFTGNEAVEAGCLYITDSATLNSNTCTFSENIAENSAVFQALLSGKIIDSGSLITNNTATVENSVGLFLDSSGSILTNTEISDNKMDKTTVNSGKAIFMVQSGATFVNATISKNQSKNEFKNFYVILSTLTLNNCTFEDDESLYTIDESTSATGGFIYLADAELIATSTHFNNGIGGDGGAIFSTLSTVTITGSTFDSNKALKTGGALYCINNIKVAITSTIFSDNLAVVGDAIHLEQSSETDLITSNTFLANLSPSFIHLTSALINITSNVFTQLSNNDPTLLTSEQLADLKVGAVLASEGESLILFQNNTITGILWDSGLVKITELERTNFQSTVQYTFNLNTFDSNIAYGSQGGAGIYLINPINANIINNTFTNNSALNGDGGCLKYSIIVSTSIINEDWTSMWYTYSLVNIKDNQFLSNYAKTKGGAISYNYLAPENSTLNTYTSNVAGKYGNNIGGVAEEIRIISEADYLANVNTSGDVGPVTRRSLAEVITNHQSGSNIATFYIGMVDKFNYIVKYGLESRVESSVTFISGQKYASFLSGTTSYIPVNGVVKVSDLVLTSTPDTQQTVSLSSEDVVTSDKLEIEITVRAWAKGEALLSSGECSECKFSLFKLGRKRPEFIFLFYQFYNF
jgi:predicted outer membrane repeat protein